MSEKIGTQDYLKRGLLCGTCALATQGALPGSAKTGSFASLLGMQVGCNNRLIPLADALACTTPKPFDQNVIEIEHLIADAALQKTPPNTC